MDKIQTEKYAACCYGLIYLETIPIISKVNGNNYVELNYIDKND